MRGYENSRIPRLFEIMAERRLRAKDICDATGITAGSITDWKSGKSIPSGDRLITLANYLEVSVEYLLGNDVPAESTLEQILHTKIKQLTDDQKADVLKYIEFLKSK